MQCLRCFYFGRQLVLNFFRTSDSGLYFRRTLKLMSPVYCLMKLSQLIFSSLITMYSTVTATEFQYSTSMSTDRVSYGL